MVAREFHRVHVFPMNHEDRARDTKILRRRLPRLFLLVNRNYLTDAYTEVVSRWIIQEQRDFSGRAHERRLLRTTSGGNIVTASRGSCETLDCNLGRPCLPESLIIALAHRGIKRKLVDRASWQCNAKQTDLRALRGNFEVTVAATIPVMYRGLPDVNACIYLIS